jgi:hypothetical protein
MSNVYSKAVQGCIINNEQAFDLAASRAAAGGRSKRLSLVLGRLAGFSLAMGICGLSAFLGMQFGDVAARSPAGKVILAIMEPVFSTLAGMSSLQALIAVVIIAVVALVCYVRG